MLHDGFGLVGFDSFGHHVHDVFHDCSSEFEIIMGLSSLFGNNFNKPFGVSAFELSGKQISEPSFKQGNDPSQEEQPNSPCRSPDTDSRSFPHWSGVEPVVNDMLDIFGHSDLSHDSILITIDASELSQMSIHVLEPIIELEGIDISKPILDITINNKFNNSENLST